MESTTGLPNPSKHGRNGKLSPFSPFPFHPSSTSFPGGSGGFPMEEQPLWLDDLLNDSETFPHRGHRRSASDSYACLGEAAVALSLDDEPGFVNAYFGSSQNLIPRSIMQAEGGGVSADLEFIEQQNMILTMENRALRQRLESISQEQMIKQCRNLYCLSSFTTTLLFFINKLMFKISAGEQGMLEREIGRLQSLYHLQKQQQTQLQHQQQPHNQHSKHRQNKSLDNQVNTSSSMKNKDAGSNKDLVNGPIRI